MKHNIYKNSSSKELDLSIFKNPTKEYRGAPFWAWNTKLNKDELIRQIDCLKEMGFGGFHIHPRTGLDNKYLGDEYLDLVSVCNEKAKESDMICYLYDEDRFSSGAAGGYTTKDYPVYRKRHITFSYNTLDNIVDIETAIEKGLDYLLCQYDIKLNLDGKLEEYYRTSKETVKDNFKRLYVYCICEKCNGWRNGGTDIDSMNKDAINRFLDITLEAYKNKVGNDFGKNIPSIFTDEPQTYIVQRLNTAFDKNFKNGFQWTNDLPITFKETYGFDILDFLPELLFDLSDDKYSYARYAYYDHTTERFVSAASDTYAKRCEELELLMTGHVMLEDALRTQTSSVGECMRFYRSMHIPGVDNLGDYARKFMTTKQAQSVAHQRGINGVMSEEYGVTGWTTDFKVYKSQGDWQAVSGITLRVPHLTWVSMKGPAKRDFPASIGPHSSWYKEFKIIEDHFARVNTALTRGEPIVKVGVIHPIESMWMIYGPVLDNQKMDIKLTESFAKINSELLNNHYDYDYICESLLPSQYKESSNKFMVGEMEYDLIIVPECITIRSTTIDILEKYVKNGGKVLFIGDKPQLVDGKNNDRIDKLFELSANAKLENFVNHEMLKNVSTLKIFNNDNSLAKNLVYCMRQDGDSKWVFVSHFDGEYKQYKEEEIGQKIKIIIDGEYYPELYNTLTGEVQTISFEIQNGKTVVFSEMYDNDTLLIKYLLNNNIKRFDCEKEFVSKQEVILEPLAAYSCSEPNVLLLDRAEYKVDNGEWQAEEILVPLNKRLRVENGYEKQPYAAAQPWTIPDYIDKVITLRFTVFSDITTDVSFCYESGYDLTLNDNPIFLEEDGWYVDFDIKKSKKFTLPAGKNSLTIKVPFSRKHYLENYYLIGDFGVKVLGGFAKIVSKEEKIGYSSIVYQGMPFYGGAISYKTKIQTQAGVMRITARDFAGALVRVFVDGKDAGEIAFAPYSLIVEGLSEGEHALEFKVYANRENTFGRVYNRYPSSWYDTNQWFPNKSAFSIEYCLFEMGLTHSPKIEIGELLNTNID